MARRESSSEESGRIRPSTRSWQSSTFPVLGERAKLKMWEEEVEVVVGCAGLCPWTAASRTQWSHLLGMRRSVTGECLSVKSSIGTSQGFHEHLQLSISLSASKAWVRFPYQNPRSQIAWVTCLHIRVYLYLWKTPTGAATNRCLLTLKLITTVSGTHASTDLNWPNAFLRGPCNKTTLQGAAVSRQHKQPRRKSFSSRCKTKHTPLRA